jgi:hypothetical protein
MGIQIIVSVPLTRMDPAPGPAPFVSDLQEVNKKLFYLLCFYTYSANVVNPDPDSVGPWIRIRYGMVGSELRSIFLNNVYTILTSSD